MLFHQAEFSASGLQSLSSSSDVTAASPLVLRPVSVVGAAEGFPSDMQIHSCVFLWMNLMCGSSLYSRVLFFFVFVSYGWRYKNKYYLSVLYSPMWLTVTQKTKKSQKPFILMLWQLIFTEPMTFVRYFVWFFEWHCENKQWCRAVRGGRSANSFLFYPLLLKSGSVDLHVPCLIKHVTGAAGSESKPYSSYYDLFIRGCCWL